MIDAKKIEKYKNLLLGVPGVTKAEYTNTIQSSVTTSWGVAWNADYIAHNSVLSKYSKQWSRYKV